MFLLVKSTLLSKIVEFDWTNPFLTNDQVWIFFSSSDKPNLNSSIFLKEFLSRVLINLLYASMLGSKELIFKSLNLFAK